MKNILLSSVLFLLCAGCTSINVTKTTADGGRIDFKAVSLFSNSMTKGLKVDGTTKTTSSLLGITQTVTEPNSESITATGSALGEFTGSAIKAAGKP